MRVVVLKYLTHSATNKNGIDLMKHLVNPQLRMIVRFPDTTDTLILIGDWPDRKIIEVTDVDVQITHLDSGDSSLPQGIFYRGHKGQRKE